MATECDFCVKDAGVAALGFCREMMKGTVPWAGAGKSWANDPQRRGQPWCPALRAALAALLMCLPSAPDDGSHCRVQALVAGQDSCDYAAPASVAVCMHIST